MTASIERHFGTTIASHHGGSIIHEGSSTVGRAVTNCDGQHVRAGGSSIGSVIATLDGDNILYGGGRSARISGGSVGNYTLNGSPSRIVAAALFMAAQQLGK